MKLERCLDCDEPTGYARKMENSLYVDEQGPYCDGCYVEALRAEIERLREEMLDEEIKAEASEKECDTWRLVAHDFESRLHEAIRIADRPKRTSYLLKPIPPDPGKESY